jgi:pimeloyl-ACP methyl ester carboxylesterase
MNNLRKHGTAPFGVAVVHGGPGAAGEMAPVALELAAERGVLEPYQTAASVAGQIEELKTVIERHGESPIILVGFSWGAWLSLYCAADHPDLVRKLILVGSGPFEEKYADRIAEIRLGRLNDQDKEEMALLYSILDNEASDQSDLNRAFRRFGALFTKADAFNARDEEPDAGSYRADIFLRVWPEAAEMRRSGKLLEAAGRVKCPVVAIHGNHDPHPAEGVKIPLSAALDDFRFFILHQCGHRPWTEHHARGDFFRVLKEEL